MEELYREIERRIRETGCELEISGEEFYNEVSDEADLHENGTYVFLIKKTEEVFYQGCMTIMDSEFDLHYVDINDGDRKWHVDFDN